MVCDLIGYQMFTYSTFSYYSIQKRKKMGYNLLCDAIFCSEERGNFGTIHFLVHSLYTHSATWWSLAGCSKLGVNVTQWRGMSLASWSPQSAWEKMSLVLPLTFSIIFFCNHFKIDRMFRCLIFSPFKSSVSPFFCDLSIMIVKDSSSMWVNSLKRLSFSSSRTADWSEFSFVKCSPSAFCQSLFLQSLHSL